jgi:hypothetical protein
MIDGFCSKCHKIWTLETRQGVCQWCGKLAASQTNRAQALRSVKSRANGRKRQADGNHNGYDQLTGDWLTYYKVAKTYENRVPVQDREDIRHDIMIELDRATKRDGKPLPQLRAYRIASLMVALYYRELNRFSARVCVYSGYPKVPQCKGCSHKSEGKRCIWLAVRPVESLDSEIVDDDGYRVSLLDTVATDKALDLPDKWYELNEVRQGLPLRLVVIAYKRLEGIPLTGAERKYLCKALKQAQKRLF